MLTFNLCRQIRRGMSENSSDRGGSEGNRVHRLILTHILGLCPPFCPYTSPQYMSHPCFPLYKSPYCPHYLFPLPVYLPSIWTWGGGINKKPLLREGSYE